MPNTKKNSNPGGGGNPANLTGHGSGQQTSGKRGEKLNKEDKMHYRSSQQNKKSGKHGGNR